MTLGERIQELRRARGLSQEGLGEKLGVSRQAVSRWEMDGAVPEVDKLVEMSRLFSVTVGQLLGVEPPDLSPRKGGRAPAALRAALVLLSAAVVVLGVAAGMLWGENRALVRQAARQEEEEVYSGDRAVFARAECGLSDITLGFPQARGTEDLTLTFDLELAEGLEDYEIAGLQALIVGDDPWGEPRGEPHWERTEYVKMDGRETASLTLPEYGGERVEVTAVLRDTLTGRTVQSLAPVFQIQGETSRAENFAVNDISVECNPAPNLPLPESVVNTLSDPRFS